MTGRDDRLLRRGSLAVAALATTILVGGVVLGTESAIAAPLKLTVKSRTYAIDGTDVYWLRSVMQSRYESDDLLMRTSMLDGSTQRLHRYPNAGSGLPKTLMAGGGTVAVGVTTFSDRSVLDPLQSRVDRFSRDGARREVIDNSKPGCANSVELLDVGPSGGVALLETVGERTNPTCGGSKNVNHLTFLELSASGQRREFFKIDRKSEDTEEIPAAGGLSASFPAVIESVDLSGDFVVYTMIRSRNAYVRNLGTGEQRGPYTPILRGHTVFSVNTIDSTGRLARLDVRYSKRRGAFRNRVYSSPTEFRDLGQLAFPQFCANRLLSWSRGGIKELDPVTLKPVRTVIPKLGRSQLDTDNCSSGTHVYATFSGRGSTQIKAYPLGAP